MKPRCARAFQLSVLIVFSLAVAACKPLALPPKQPAPLPMNQGEQTAQVVLNFGDEIATYAASLETTHTALSALAQVASASGHTVTTKTYPFGTLVEAIDAFANSADNAWIYFVNGQPASVGASDYEVHPGDVIEWQYLKPE